MARLDDDTAASTVTGPGREHRARGRLRATAINLGLVAGAGIFALLMAELMVRAVLPQQLVLKRPDVWQPDSQLGWARRPGVATTLNTGERETHMATDAHGYRVGAQGPVESDLRVLLLGDSFMEALSVEYEESLAGVLERQLPADLGEPVAVRNTGVSGWDPNQYFIQARRSFTLESFSLVLAAIYLGNDVILHAVDSVPPRPAATVHPLRVPRGLGRREVVDAVLYPLNDMLETRSHLFVLVKARLYSVFMRLGLTPDYSYLLAYYRPAAAGIDHWAATARICRRIAQLATTHGSATLFVLIPAPAAVDPAVLREQATALGVDAGEIDADQPRRLLEQAMLREGLSVLDATPALRAALRDGTQPFGRADYHLTALGHAALAAVVRPRVVELLRGSATRPTGGGR